MCYSLTVSDAPPSYDQLFGMGQMKQQVQEARADSANKGVFAAKLCEIFCGSGKEWIVCPVLFTCTCICVHGYENAISPSIFIGASLSQPHTSRNACAVAKVDRYGTYVFRTIICMHVQILHISCEGEQWQRFRLINSHHVDRTEIHLLDTTGPSKAYRWLC